MTENEAISVLKMIEAHGSLSSKAKEMSIQALEEIQQYRAIGTVEEFKALKEKNEPKKAIGSKKYSEARCPICGSVISDDEFWALEKYARHCESCGQVVKGIDWQ